MIRLPLRGLYSNTVTATASNFANFVLPLQDFDGLVAKLTVQTITQQAGAQLNVYIQTTDGLNESSQGPYFYDCVAFGTVTGAVTTAAAQWATIPVNIGDGFFASNITGTATSGYVGSVTKLPILTPNVRVTWVTAGLQATASLNFTIQLLANNQSPHA